MTTVRCGGVGGGGVGVHFVGSIGGVAGALVVCV